MPGAVREITFSVWPDVIQPSTPQFAGVQGEHLATKVLFLLMPQWESEEKQFYFEYVDGMQGSHVSGPYTTTNGEISFLLPREWTMAGGIGELRIAAVVDDGTEETAQTAYSPVARLSFQTRERIL